MHWHRATIGALVVVVGCVSAGGSSPVTAAASTDRDYRPTVTVDSFTKARQVDLVIRRWNDAKAECSQDAGAVVTLRAVAVTPRDGQPHAFLQVYLAENHWLYLTDDSLQLLLGDAVVALPAAGAPMQRVSSGIHEEQSFHVTAEQLRALAAAPKATARVTGSQGHCDFAISPEGQRLTGLFVEHELAPATVAH